MTRAGLRGFALYKEWCRCCIGVAAVLLAGCAAAPTRPAQSTLGCATAIVREHVSPELGDKQRHCLAAGLIARHCSRVEARLVASAKEIRDLFGRGEAEWADWQADRAGLRCAAKGADDAAIVACCAGYRDRTIGPGMTKGAEPR